MIKHTSDNWPLHLPGVVPSVFQSTRTLSAEARPPKSKTAYRSCPQHTGQPSHSKPSLNSESHVCWPLATAASQSSNPPGMVPGWCAPFPFLRPAYFRLQVPGGVGTGSGTVLTCCAATTSSSSGHSGQPSQSNPSLYSESHVCWPLATAASQSSNPPGMVPGWCAPFPFLRPAYLRLQVPGGFGTGRGTLLTCFAATSSSSSGHS